MDRQHQFRKQQKVICLQTVANDYSATGAQRSQRTHRERYGIEESMMNKFGHWKLEELKIHLQSWKGYLYCMNICKTAIMPDKNLAQEPRSERYLQANIDLKKENSSHTLCIELVGKDKRVLKIGTSTGYLCKILKEQRNKIVEVGIDIDDAETAKQYCESIVIGDVEYLDLDSFLERASFDVILLVDVLENLKWPGRLLVKIKDYLKPNGYLVVSLCNATHGDSLLNFLNGNFNCPSVEQFDETQPRFFTRKDIVHIFNKYGYGIEELCTVQIPVGATKMRLDTKNVPPGMMRLIEALPDSDVYKFVFNAVPSDSPSNESVSDVSFSEVFGKINEDIFDQYDNQIALLSERLKQSDARATALENEIKEMRRSIVWQMTTKFHKVFVMRVLQQGNMKRKYDLFIKGGRILANEGWKSFWYNLNNYIKSEMSYKRNYKSWIQTNEPDSIELNRMKMESKKFDYRPKISIIVPVWNTDEKWLRAAIDSVISQSYENWELCIAEAGSKKRHVKTVLEEYRQKDGRIKVKFLNKNLGISGNSNEALSMATGEYIGLLDHDDELAPFALYEVINILNINKSLDMIYSDEDKIDVKGDRYEPFFKPDWSPDLLHSYMYIGHFTVYRGSFVKDLGGFRSSFDFSQDYDMALRATERTFNIAHIQKVLYHWRSIPESAASGGKNFARESNLAALASAVERRGYKGKAIIPREPHWVNRIKFEIVNYPFVSIVIPTDSKDNIINCIDSILIRTIYPCFEMVIVTNTNLCKILLEKYGKNSKINTVNYDQEFNFSLKCNVGAAASKGQHLLFLNDDMEVVEISWIESMVEILQRPEVGAVGAKLVYADNKIQHAGLITGVRGLVGTAFHCQPKDSQFYFHFIQSTRNVSALSAACIMVPRRVFDMIGGFDVINTPIMHSDVDLSFRIREKGYLLVYTPFAELKHFGHVSLGKIEKFQKKDRADLYLLKRWLKYIANDPYYTKNMRDLLYEDANLQYDIAINENHIDAEITKSDQNNFLFVTHDLSNSGAPYTLYNLSRFVKSIDNFITLMSPFDGPLMSYYIEQNIPVIIESGLFKKIPVVSQKLISNFDVIICNTIISYPLVHMSHSMGLHVIWFIHESNFGVEMANSNPDVANAFDAAEIVIFPSKNTANLYKNFNKKNNFHVLYQGINEFGCKSMNKRKDNKCYILNIGSIEPRKGQDLLIKSILNLPTEYMERLEVYLVGRIIDEGYNSKLKKLIGRRQNIHITGEVSRDNVEEFYKTANIYISASRDEAFPITLLEAMSQGKTIITSDVGGISEMIDNGVNGIIVPFGDTDAISKNIINLLNDENLRCSLGRNAYEKFKSTYTMENYGTDFLKLVKKLSQNKNIDS